MVNSVFERLLVNHRFLLTLLATTDSWIVFQCGSVLLERGEALVVSLSSKPAGSRVGSEHKRGARHS
jgi:hypothetical protein